jgi:hypothetical protein
MDGNRPSTRVPSKSKISVVGGLFKGKKPDKQKKRETIKFKTTQKSRQ